jgi:hypothetical protein
MLSDPENSVRQIDAFLMRATISSNRRLPISKDQCRGVRQGLNAAICTLQQGKDAESVKGVCRRNRVSPTYAYYLCPQEIIEIRRLRDALQCRKKKLARARAQQVASELAHPLNGDSLVPQGKRALIRQVRLKAKVRLRVATAAVEAILCQSKQSSVFKKIAS